MKILVIYATAGAGHKKAAEAVYQACQKMSLADVHLVDALVHTNSLYRLSYSQVYSWTITKAPWLWGFFFQILDIPAVRPLMSIYRRLHNGFHAAALSRFLREEQFDCIFSTHFLANEVAGHLKQTGAIRSRLICSVTDYNVHAIWLHPAVDQYTVATEWTRKKLLSLGVAAKKITVTGIPVDLHFGQPKDKEEIRRKLGLRNGVLTVLVATGSFGIGPIEEILASLTGFQVLVVCGHNKNLYARLSGREKGLVKILGLVDNMDELMAVADVMVTKPGGLSISEALVMGLPMIFFSAIPGQEENNVKVLQEHGVGFDSRQVSDIVAVLRRLQAVPAELSAAKEKTRILGKPNAALDVVRLAGEK